MPNFVKRYKEKGEYEKCREIRNRQRKANYASTCKYPKSEWRAEHEQMVLDHSIPDRELSKLIGHSVQAIQVKRCKLKKEIQE